MLRTPRLAALGLLFLAPAWTAACGDDSASICGAGTVEVNGSCVAVEDTNDTSDTNTSDTNDTNTTSTATATNTTDTTTTDTGTTECTNEELSTVDAGGACTKECQCDSTLGLSCYSGILMEGFSFCSRGDKGPLSAAYQTFILVPSCFGIEPSAPEASTRVVTRECATLEDCKALSSAYTHCGTGDLAYTGPGASGTECVRLDSATQVTATMSSRKLCIIDSLPPFSYSLGTDTP